MSRNRQRLLSLALTCAFFAGMLSVSVAQDASAATLEQRLALSGTVASALKTPKPKWTLPKRCKDKQAKILYKAGFDKPGMLRGAWAITWRESKHQALDESSPWYTGALGTWQIQTSAWSGKSWWSRSAMLDKYTQSRIVKKYFLKGGMHNWGYGYSFKSDAWFENAGMYYSLWGSSLTYAWVIAPFNTGWSLFPKACR